MSQTHEQAQSGQQRRAGEHTPGCTLTTHSLEHTADVWGLGWPGKAEALHQAHEAPGVDAVVCPTDSLDFARTEHLIYEGDNLDALKLLLPALCGQVRLIYIDPPYNTGNTYIYSDNLRTSRRQPRSPVDFSQTAHPAKSAAAREGIRPRSAFSVDGDNFPQPEPRPRARSTWADTHAAWLSMLYPRLVLARDLLRPDGAICLSIGEEEVHHARMLMDEVFGEEQHRNTLAVRRQDKNLSRQFMDQGLLSLAVGFEYILIYARSPAFVMHPIFRTPSERRRAQGYWKGFWNAADRPTMRYPLLGVTPEAGQWKWREEVALAAVANYAQFEEAQRSEPLLTLEEYWQRTGECLRFIRRNTSGRGRNRGVEHWIPPSVGILRTSNWTDQLISESLHSLDLPFDNPKRVALLKDLLRLCADEESLILDFFAGSGSTGQAVWELNLEDGGHRRFILVQRPEPTSDPRFPTIAEITKERLRRASAHLAKAPHSQQRPEVGDTEDGNHADASAPRLDLGFRVLKLVPQSGENRVYENRVYRNARDIREEVPPMATDKALAERLASYLEPAGPIRIRAMMGGYLVYLDDVYIAVVDGESLYIKRTPAGDALTAGIELANFYEGAKPAYKLTQADLERTEWLVELAQATREALKEKTPRKK